MSNGKDSEMYDALVIGGGPAGAAAATILAQKGRRVLVLEKDKFPRYRVGESLMPYCYFTLERLGVLDRINDESFARVEKHSVQFVTTDGRISTPFYFFEHLKHDAAKTWQVVRSEFDKMLLDNARATGALVREGVTVRQPIYQEHAGNGRPGGTKVVGVVATDENGETREFRAKVTIDASGRDALMLSKHDWKLRDPSLKKIAVWTYYKGALRDPGLDEGATTIAYLPKKGWFWYIPLPGDTTSVGIVAEREYLYRDMPERDPAALFQREIKKNAWIKQHLAQGEQFGKFYVTGDYSYRSKYCAVDGLVLVGDAFAFLDPVFSSGVFLALRSGELAADAIDMALDRGDVGAEAFAEYGEQMCQGLEAMRMLVYAFYDQAFSFGKLIKSDPMLRPDLTDCLIGHLFKDFDKLFEGVARFASLPPPLAHGRPRVECDAASQAACEPSDAQPPAPSSASP